MTRTRGVPHHSEYMVPMDPLELREMKEKGNRVAKNCELLLKKLYAKRRK